MVENGRRDMDKMTESNDEIKHMIEQMRKQFHSHETTDLDPKTLHSRTKDALVSLLQKVNAID